MRQEGRSLLGSENSKCKRCWSGSKLTWLTKSKEARVPITKGQKRIKSEMQQGPDPVEPCRTLTAVIRLLV